MSEQSAENLGASIKRCTEFMGSVHGETQMLLMEISGIMEKHKFESVRGTSIFVPDRSSFNIQSPGAWCHKVVARLFGEGGRHRSSARVVAVEAHLAPAFEVDEAVLVLGYARLSKGEGREALQASYERGWIAGVFDEEEFKFGTVQKRVRGASDGDPFPDAVEVRAIAWPLVSLDSPEKVRRTISEGLRKLGVIEAQ
jgi:hypothetical protein